MQYFVFSSSSRLVSDGLARLDFDDSCPDKITYSLPETMPQPASAFVEFASKGLHICNLNIRHIVPKIDEIRILLSNEKCPGILGMCETFLKKNNPESQLCVVIIRKDRSDVEDKSGGGLLIYYK